MIDARLLVPAAGVWMGAAVGLTVLDGRSTVAARCAAAALALPVLACLAVAGVGLVAVVHAGLKRTLPERLRSVLVASSAVVAGLLAVCVWTVRTTPEPVAGWIDARATTVVAGVVIDEPRTRVLTRATAWGESSWLELRVRAERMSARGTDLEVRVPIVLRTSADARVPAPGSRIRAVGRLAASPGVSGAAATLRVGDDAIEVTDAPGVLADLAHRMRVGLRTALGGTPPDAGALVAGLALGDESRQPPGLADDMRASGLAHLTAVSGGNVAVILGAVLALAALLRLGLLARAALAAAGLGFFVLLVGDQPSVLRAAVMGVAALVAIVVGGRRSGPSVVGAAVLGLVMVQPWLALSWGFALSVLATVGLVLVAPVLRERLARARLSRRWPAAVHEATALTLAAQLATLPVLVAMGATVGWVTVPANLVAMPAVPAVTVLGLLAAGVSVVMPGLAVPVAHLAAWPAGWIAGAAHLAASLPGAAMRPPSGWPGVACVCAVGLGGWLLRRVWRTRLGSDVPRPLRASVLGALALAVVVVVVAPPSRRGWPPEGWLMIMCDVGQGDGLVLRSGPGRAVVVDAGPDPDLMDACLSDAGIAAVDALVLTHFHADHVGGVAGVLHGRSVGAVLATPIRDPVEEARLVDALVQARGLAVQPLTAGDRRRVGDVEWRALWPRRLIRSGSVPNNASVVLAATIHGRTLLLAGDIEPEAQSAIGADLRAIAFDVVKVPHHGSANQQPDLPHRAPARVALISVGAGNDYGHPAAETVAAWQTAGALVERTDEEGDIAVVATASGIGVVTRRDMLPPS